MTRPHPGFYANASPVLLPRLKKNWMQSTVGPHWSTALNRAVQRGDVRVGIWYRNTQQNVIAVLLPKALVGDWCFSFFQIWPRHELVLKIKINILKHNQTYHQGLIWAYSMPAFQTCGLDVFLSSSMFTEDHIYHSLRRSCWHHVCKTAMPFLCTVSY